MPAHRSRPSALLALALLAAGKVAAAEPKAVDAVAAAAPAAAAQDPLEHLRLRLAERLRARAAPASSPYDLQVTTRLPAPTDRGRSASVATPRPTPTPDWSYEGATGPQAWAALSPQWALCASGQRQSPVDLRGGLPVSGEALRFDYRPGAFSVVDDGRTLRVEPAPGNLLDFGGRRWALRHFTLHRPGEGRIDGRDFPMSLHLLHADEAGQLLIVALLLDEGGTAPQPLLQQVLAHLPLEPRQAVVARVPLDPAALLPAMRGYYTTMGSLSTPPCTEGVQWVVMRHPVALSTAQLRLFERVLPYSARPLQPLAGRRILQTD